MKFADDTSNDENSYQEEINNIVEWCTKNNLVLGITIDENLSWSSWDSVVINLP